jgi:flagellar assembly protein FliH
MSFKARRLTNPASVVSFAWDGVSRAAKTPPPAAEPAPSEADAAAEAPANVAAIEREVYARGYQDGERAGVEAGGQRADAVIARLGQTLDELATLRAQMIRQTERQMVELALAVARRIIHREVTLDRDLLIAMARVALDRLGESEQVTIRLHPDDFAATGAARVSRAMGTSVTVVEDARLERGSCLVESQLGTLDVSVDSQIEEVARALLGARRMTEDGGADREPMSNAA